MNRNQFYSLIGVGLFIGYQMGRIKKKQKHQSKMISVMAEMLQAVNEYIQEQDAMDYNERFDDIVTEEDWNL